MKTSRSVAALFTLLLLAPFARAGKEVDRLLADYGKIETVTCKVRRTKEGGAGKIKFLSRVYWTNRDQINAEGLTPIKRRTVCDGNYLFQYVEGAPRGFARPVGQLSEQMQISLRFVPGTAMDILLHLTDSEEKVLPAEGNNAKSIGVLTEKNYTVLGFDQKDRLVSVTFYKTPNQEFCIATYEYCDFAEPIPGVWVPLTHHVSIENAEMTFKETVKVDHFTVNEPLGESLFMPSEYFDKGVDFVDDFAKISPSNK